ncbi:MAG: transporter substrate-binding domain-containing protein [Deltaproteobacteria bacterium]|nr:transporter substrate-binding domain-containing protein [Deltaproteobacteria bacterium]
MRVRPLHSLALAALVLLPACPAKEAPPPVEEQPEPAPPRRGDLPVIAARGRLEVLAPPALEPSLHDRFGMLLREREVLADFARRRGLELVILEQPSAAAAVVALEAGEGDLAITVPLTEARKARLAFGPPLGTVEEWLVGLPGPDYPDDLPTSLRDLGEREIVVPASSAVAELLAARRSEPPRFRLVLDEERDAAAIAAAVAAGEVPLTVLPRPQLAELSNEYPALTALLMVNQARSLGWALRPDAPELLLALRGFLTEKAMTGHTEELFTGDLDGIRQRGVLRVITRNNPVTYFLYNGSPRGFDYLLVQRLADRLKVRLEMVLAPSRDLLIPWLLEGRGDLVAASLTVTPDRAEQVTFSRPYLHVDEILVEPAAAPPVTSKEALAGRTVHVRPSSSYHRTLKALGVGVRLVAADETKETEELIDEVARGAIPLTVADSHILQTELTWRDDVRAGLNLTGAEPEEEGEQPKPAKAIAFAMRPGSPRLERAVNAFVAASYRDLEYNMARQRYFESSRRIAQANAWRVPAEEEGRISPYDDLIRKYSAKYGLDWRLMAALAFQESGFDPEAVSWVGAQGLFQVMPATGKELGFTNLKDPEQGIHAGIKYLRQLIDRIDPKLPFRQRVRMAMAAYNAGLGHVQDARRLAARRRLDPDRWFGHVEKAMLLLEKPRFHRWARHGYVRGREPVKYVSEIQNRYDNYVKLVPE